MKRLILNKKIWISVITIFTSFIFISFFDKKISTYTQISNFQEGLAIVEQYQHQSIVAKIIRSQNLKNSIGFKINLTEINFFQNSSLDSIYKYGFIDKNGKLVIPIKYDQVGNFIDGLAPVQINEKWGFIDKNGKIRVDIKYENQLIPFFQEGLARVELKGKWGFIDKNGKIIIPIQYEITSFEERFVRFKNDSLNQIRDGDLFYEGLVRVKLNKKWGFIDKRGCEVITLKYDFVEPFELGKAKVILSQKSFFIDKKGKYIK